MLALVTASATSSKLWGGGQWPPPGQALGELSGRRSPCGPPLLQQGEGGLLRWWGGGRHGMASRPGVRVRAGADRSRRAHRAS